MHVLIIDDHPLFREGLRALLSSLDPSLDAKDVSSVSDARALQVSGYMPQLILLDMNLPGVNRLEALHEVKALFQEAGVVVVSAEEDPLLIRRVIEAGGAGYIPKTTDVAVTIQALRLVLANGIYLPAAALGTATLSAGSAHMDGEKLVLSPRQHDVLRCLLQGKANKVIARELNMAEGTVKAHLWAVYRVLDVNSRAQAMYRAHELGLFAHPGES